MPKKSAASLFNGEAASSRREFITRTVLAVGAAVVPGLVTATPAAWATPKQDVRPGTENPEVSASPKPYPDASPSSFAIQPSSSPISVTPSASPATSGTTVSPTRSRTREAVQQPADLSVEKSTKRYEFF